MRPANESQRYKYNVVSHLLDAYIKCSVIYSWHWSCLDLTYSISQEICTRFLLCCALLWLYIDWFSHIHQAYFTGTVAIKTIAPVPAKQPWWIWINTSCEFIMNDCITTTNQSTTKPFAYFLGYIVWFIKSHLVFAPRPMSSRSTFAFHGYLGRVWGSSHCNKSTSRRQWRLVLFFRGASPYVFGKLHSYVSQ